MTHYFLQSPKTLFWGHFGPFLPIFVQTGLLLIKSALSLSCHLSMPRMHARKQVWYLCSLPHTPNWVSLQQFCNIIIWENEGTVAHFRYIIMLTLFTRKMDLPQTWLKLRQIAKYLKCYCCNIVYMFHKQYTIQT